MIRHAAILAVKEAGARPKARRGKRLITDRATVWQEGTLAHLDGEPVEIGHDVAFRLAARRGDESWEVPVRQVDAGHWEAVDDSPRLQAGGTVVYSLACRSADGAWRELDSRAIDVATPALRTALTAVRTTIDLQLIYFASLR